MSENILELKGVTMQFGGVVAVDDFSMDIEKGKTVALIGPNGAGKSTTLNMVCSLLKPTSGNIEIFGMKTSNDMEKIKKKIGYIPQELAIYYLT